MSRTFQTIPTQSRPAAARPGHRRLNQRLTGRSLALAALMLAGAGPAAAQMAFSANCTVHTQIAVNPPQNAILFSKHPVPHPAGTATVFSINGLDNYVIPAGFNSCIVAAPDPVDDYCFQARNDPTILQVGYATIVNPGGLTACQ